MLRPEALYSMFVEDPHVLERMDGVAFGDTPLHVAAGCRCWEQPFCDGNGKLKALAGSEAKSSLAQHPCTWLCRGYSN